jgi:hypothetical protein
MYTPYQTPALLAPKPSANGEASYMKGFSARTPRGHLLKRTRHCALVLLAVFRRVREGVVVQMKNDATLLALVGHESGIVALDDELLRAACAVGGARGAPVDVYGV